MKPRQWIVAIGASLAAVAGPSLAQTSVAIYGIVDAGMQVSSFGNGTSYALQSGIADGSRLGFRGTEDLGGGWKTIFTLEARIELDNGTNSNGYVSDGFNQNLVRGLPAPVAAALAPSIVLPARVVNPNGALFDRTSAVGLVTPYGAILAGRQYSAGYEILALADPFEAGTAAGWGNIAGGAGGFITPGIAIRYSNTLQYRIELPSGIGASLMYGFEDTGSTNLSKHAYGANLRYKANGWNVGVGYNQEEDQNGNRSLRSALAGGSYSLGPAKFFLGYLRMQNDHSVLVPLLTPQLTAATGSAVLGNALTAIVANNARLDADSFTIGAHYAIGSGRVMAGISRVNDRLASNNDATLYGLGYDYNLSKRTDLYVFGAHIANERNAQYALGGAGYTGGATSGPGVDGDALQFGIRHRF